MDNNELSFESIFAKGMGISIKDDTSTSQSVERFDGDFDTVFADISKSEEDLDFVEKFGLLDALNTKAKLNMLAKINKAYGKCNRGIENYCRSIEAEVDGTAALKDKSGSASQPSVDTTKKRANWLKRVLSVIGGFFKKIWQAIVTFFKNISAKIKNFFTKNKAKADLDKASSDVKTAKKNDSNLSAEDAKKLNNLIDKSTGSVNKLQIVVNKVCTKNDEAIKDLEKIANATSDKENAEIKGVYNNLLVCSAAIKLLSQCGKVVLKVSQKIFANITKTRVVSTAKLGEFCVEYSSAANFLMNAYDKIKGHKTGQTNEIRTKFGEDIYKTYDTVSKLVQKTIGYKTPAVAKTDFTNPSTSGKKMSDVINTLSRGVSDVYTDIDKTFVVFKKVAKDMFGVDVNEKF